MTTTDTLTTIEIEARESVAGRVLAIVRRARETGEPVVITEADPDWDALREAILPGVGRTRALKEWMICEETSVLLRSTHRDDPGLSIPPVRAWYGYGATWAHTTICRGGRPAVTIHRNYTTGERHEEHHS